MKVKKNVNNMTTFLYVAHVDVHNPSTSPPSPHHLLSGLDCQSKCVFIQTICICLTLTYVDGGLLFVSSQDPDLNVSFHEGLDGFGYFVLKFVFNRCGPQQLQVLQRNRQKIY